MDTLSQTFEERLQEIETYLDLLDALERHVQGGPPAIANSIITNQQQIQYTITTQQQKILYSCVYLQLYNLVEATVNWCVKAVCDAATDNSRWLPSDLSVKLRREWVRSTARTHIELNQEKRLDHAVELCDVLVESLPVVSLTVDKKSNWDDYEIEAITARLGCDLRINQNIYSGIKRPIRDDMGALVLVKDLRNKLAHGSLSFSECGDGATVLDLRDLKQRTALYLREVVAAFEAYIDSYEYVIPQRRPVLGSQP